jgi:hypothetical protein
MPFVFTYSTRVNTRISMGQAVAVGCKVKLANIRAGACAIHYLQLLLFMDVSKLERLSSLVTTTLVYVCRQGWNLPEWG